MADRAVVMLAGEIQQIGTLVSSTEYVYAANCRTSFNVNIKIKEADLIYGRTTGLLSVMAKVR